MQCYQLRRRLSFGITLTHLGCSPHFPLLYIISPAQVYSPRRLKDHAHAAPTVHLNNKFRNLELHLLAWCALAPSSVPCQTLLYPVLPVVLQLLNPRQPTLESLLQAPHRVMGVRGHYNHIHTPTRPMPSTNIREVAMKGH